MKHIIWKSTDVTDEHIAYIFMASSACCLLDACTLLVLLFGTDDGGVLFCRNTTWLYDVISQKIEFFNYADVSVSFNLLLYDGKKPHESNFPTFLLKSPLSPLLRPSQYNPPPSRIATLFTRMLVAINAMGILSKMFQTESTTNW
jgi:hypothetical protein